MHGYKMSNVLVIYFEPNCTPHVQPLDAGCIQAAKAFYRKRRMTWVLQQLSNTTPGERPLIKCNIRQAIEWFMSALHSIPEGVTFHLYNYHHSIVDALFILFICVSRIWNTMICLACRYYKKLLGKDKDSLSRSSGRSLLWRSAQQ
jgi:hypothetical protein